ncbi:MAG: hypothetical protein ACOVNR_03985, partial [Chitinophagaceae bacterium]
MKAQQILQAELLDILFENKNKMYGAYELRKNYANRLWLSLIITALVCLLTIALQHLMVGSNNYLKTSFEAKDFYISEPPNVSVKPKEITPPPPPKPVSQQKMIKLADIIIVKDKDFFEKDIVPPVEEAEKSIIGEEKSNNDDNSA